ncbi:MAG: hypothetical protein ABSD27_09580 [Bryobacteraceae bacterium]|jgi:hypothetical protein
MDLHDSLKLERYKFVTDRQKYFTELARDAFASYARLFSGLAAAGVALVSTRTKLELRPAVLLYLINGILYLTTFLGLVTSAQIVFCLARWWEFRNAERKMNPDSPPIGWWWWLFETLYVMAILVAVVGAWCVARQLPELLRQSAP